MSTKKNIVIFFWEGYISVAPTIINLSNSLAEKGHKVLILIRDTGTEYSPEVEMQQNVSICKLSGSKKYNRLFTLTQRIPRVRDIFNIYAKERLFLSDIINQSKGVIEKYSEPYDCIGVDSIGLYWASKLLNKNSNLYYLSLELLCLSTIKAQDRFLRWVKEKEIYIHKKMVRKTIIQDQFRLNVLYHENNIVLNENYHILTNSPRNKDGNALLKRGDFFNKLFSLPENCVILLMAGMIDELVMSSDIAKSFSKFKNSNINLVFHERQKRDCAEIYLQELKIYGGKNFYLSLNPLPYSKINLIYGSADIGLVFYDKHMGDNIEFIIGASGKLTHYLMNRMPVIAINLPGFNDLFSKYNVGVVIDSVSELEAAVETILAKYQFYSENAFKCYNEEYDFDLQFDSFYKANFSTITQ